MKHMSSALPNALLRLQQQEVWLLSLSQHDLHFHPPVSPLHTCRDIFRITRQPCDVPLHLNQDAWV